MAEQETSLPLQDMLGALDRAAGHCAYAPDADRIRWAAEFLREHWTEQKFCDCKDVEPEQRERIGYWHHYGCPLYLTPTETAQAYA